MTADETLLAFLRGCLGAKRDRVLDFVSRPKARAKFLAMLYHELPEFLDQACVVTNLPSAAWTQMALRFAPPNEFGIAVPTLRQAFDELVQPELVVTIDARYGFWGDETIVDAQILIAARPTKSAR